MLSADPKENLQPGGFQRYRLFDRPAGPCDRHIVCKQLPLQEIADALDETDFMCLSLIVSLSWDYSIVYFSY